MKKILLSLLLLITASTSHAADDFGAGIVFGEPTGLSGKYWVEQDRAFDMGLAYSFDKFFLIYSDYLFHFHGAFGRNSKFLNELYPYLGGGLILAVNTDNNGRGNGAFEDGSVGLGIRIPVGAEWRPADPPIGVFLEIAPGLGIIPDTSGLLEGGIGFRYYFQ